MNTMTFNAGIAYADYGKKLIAYVIAAVVAFLMSAYFVVGYLAGTIHFWLWTTDQFLNGLVATGLTATMTAYQFFLYAQGDVAGGKKATIAAVIIAVGFSLLSELGQGMERDHVRMETKSLESPTYKALVNQLGQAGSITASPYSSDLQQAQARLNGCLEKMRQGSVDNCVHSQGRVDAVRQMINDYQSNQSTHSLAMVDAAKKMERDESNYHPLVNLIRTSLGTTGIIASFLLSLAIICFFEYAFHYLGGLYAQARDNLHQHGYDTTRRARATPRSLGSSSASSAAPNRSPTPSPQPSADGQNSVTVQPSATPSVARSAPSADGRTPSPKQSVLGTHEEQLGLLPVLDEKHLEHAYQDWAALLSAGQIDPTIRPAKRWISERDLATGIKAIEALANDWLSRAEREGLIKNNPDAGIGKPKYILA